MEETLNVCFTCLSTDRCFIPLHKITMLLQEIHFEQLKEFHGGVCWECWSIMVKFYRLKKKAKIAQHTLSQTIQPFNIKPLTTLTSKTNVFYDYQYTYSLDPDTKLKVEPETIKQEIIDQSENIDNTSDSDEKKSDFYEEVNIFYDSDPLTNCDTKLKAEPQIVKQEIIDQIENIDNTSDSDEKKSDFYEEVNIVYDNDPLSNCDTKLKAEPQIVKQEIIDQIENTSDFDEKETNFNEEVKIVYDNVIERKQDVMLMRKLDHKVSDDVSIHNASDLDEKTLLFEQVVLSEEEMLRAREGKRNHHNFKNLPYKCDSCVRGFTRKDTYNLHLEKKHNESVGDHICDVCSIRFRHKVTFNNHKNKHYVVYRCRLCKYEVHDFMWAVNHCKTKHAADKSDSIHCSQCTVVVKTPDDLEKHVETEHTLFCECGIKFKNKNNLRQHMRRAHSVLCNFICDICKKTFKTKTRLETHMLRHSDNSEGFPCSECDSKFRFKRYLKQHYDFYHLRKSQSKCEVCNKVFISNWRLRNHKQLYHGLSRPRNHSCSTCGKKFYTSRTLRNHQFTHSDQRSFMCEDCGDTFKQSAALYTHTRLLHKGGGTKKKRDC